MRGEKQCCCCWEHKCVSACTEAEANVDGNVLSLFRKVLPVDGAIAAADASTALQTLLFCNLKEGRGAAEPAGQLITM